MIKRVRRIATSKQFFLIWAGVFAALIGLVSGFFEIFSDMKPSLGKALMLVIVSCVVSGLYALTTTSLVHFPVDDVVPQIIHSQPYMSLEITTNRDLLAQTNQLAAGSYPGVEPLPAERYEQWLMINPTILVCLIDSNRRVVGYFDVFPLEESFFNLFIAGTCTELDIRREHILTPEQAKVAKRIYFGGIAVQDPKSVRGKRYASMLVWGALKYLQHYYCVPCETELYAEAVSKEGEELLRRFGFRLITPANQRRDKSAIFAIALTDETIRKGIASLPDWSGSCNLVWDEVSHPAHLLPPIPKRTSLP